MDRADDGPPTARQTLQQADALEAWATVQPATEKTNKHWINIQRFKFTVTLDSSKFWAVVDSWAHQTVNGTYQSVCCNFSFLVCWPPKHKSKRRLLKYQTSFQSIHDETYRTNYLSGYFTNSLNTENTRGSKMYLLIPIPTIFFSLECECKETAVSETNRVAGDFCPDFRDKNR